MDMLSRLADPGCWQRYYAYKVASGQLLAWELQDLKAFIDGEKYLPVVAAIRAGEPFPLPRRAEIGKLYSAKKRVVYTYPKAENYVLKLLTYLMIREYDPLFPSNLYSFRAGIQAKDAVEKLVRTPGIGQMYSYKADIRNYFNSIPIPKLLPILREALPEEPELYRFLEGLLMETRVRNMDQTREEEKGIMAGTPIAAFLANLYLTRMDRWFLEQGRLYARYSDDIILFAPSREELERDIVRIHDFLGEFGLRMNPDKESRTQPGESWVFLGFAFRDGKIDIAPASVDKLKGKMRRKTRALARWKDKNGKEGVHAARAFIKVFNRKLFETTPEHELTWARWYFPVLTTAESLAVIDHYAQDCIRYLYTGSRKKSAYNCRYEDMKNLGYVSLVNRYYRRECVMETETKG